MIIEDIKILLVKKELSLAALSRLLGESPQNFGLKLKRGYIKDNELKEIGKALDLEIEIIYRDKQTGKEIYKSKL